jgi:hypothetical protein
VLAAEVVLVAALTVLVVLVAVEPQVIRLGLLVRQIQVAVVALVAALTLQHRALAAPVCASSVSAPRKLSNNDN